MGGGGGGAGGRRKPVPRTHSSTTRIKPLPMVTTNGSPNVIFDLHPQGPVPDVGSARDGGGGGGEGVPMVRHPRRRLLPGRSYEKLDSKSRRNPRNEKQGLEDSIRTREERVYDQQEDSSPIGTFGVPQGGQGWSKDFGPSGEDGEEDRERFIRVGARIERKGKGFTPDSISPLIARRSRRSPVGEGCCCGGGGGEGLKRWVRGGKGKVQGQGRIDLESEGEDEEEEEEEEEEEDVASIMDATEDISLFPTQALNANSDQPPSRSAFLRVGCREELGEPTTEGLHHPSPTNTAVRSSQASRTTAAMRFGKSVGSSIGIFEDSYCPHGTVPTWFGSTGYRHEPDVSDRGFVPSSSSTEGVPDQVASTTPCLAIPAGEGDQFPRQKVPRRSNRKSHSTLSRKRKEVDQDVRATTWSRTTKVRVEYTIPLEPESEKVRSSDERKAIREAETILDQVRNWTSQAPPRTRSDLRWVDQGRLDELMKRLKGTSSSSSSKPSVSGKESLLLIDPKPPPCRIDVWRESRCRDANHETRRRVCLKELKEWGEEETEGEEGWSGEEGIESLEEFQHSLEDVSGKGPDDSEVGGTNRETLGYRRREDGEEEQGTKPNETLEEEVGRRREEEREDPILDDQVSPNPTWKIPTREEEDPLGGLSLVPPEIQDPPLYCPYRGGLKKLLEKTKRVQSLASFQQQVVKILIPVRGNPLGGERAKLVSGASLSLQDQVEPCKKRHEPGGGCREIRWTEKSLERFKISLDRPLDPYLGRVLAIHHHREGFGSDLLEHLSVLCPFKDWLRVRNRILRILPSKLDPEEEGGRGSGTFPFQDANYPPSPVRLLLCDSFGRPLVAI
ncbi:hypothetical protein IE53DRAFT_385091 [Violaceomyces palustris]|uniref:Uncharacterized protein n=1 Tax=Violaceomyces palustris TaxID=1673888 RepID=A0ACD0P3G0_9BASI|nr:hypothetical protein IE53DRAFT_385091 [Violaceomyces palustris]